jgi:protein-tyrosine phosphatase
VKKVLFVCTGNSCRSVMAEWIFKKLTEGREAEFRAGSAGISAMDGFPPTEDTVQVMRESGIDVTRHRTRRLVAPLLDEADHVYVMEQFHRDWIAKLFPGAKGKVRLLSEYAGENEPYRQADIPDPIRMSPQFYRNVFGMIERCVKKIVEEL